MTNISDNDLRKFFVSYWLLHSSLYDFAQGLNNQRKRRFTWAITNYYYSIVFIGRLLMFLSKNLYFTGHSQLVKFFKGENVSGIIVKLQDDTLINEGNIQGNYDNSLNVEVVGENIGLDSEELKKFGKILEKLKNFRNRNTYEPFIIYAQENHRVLTDFIFSATDKVREVVEKYLKKACKIYINYWKNKSKDFLGLVNHKWLIPTTLEVLKNHDLPESNIKSLINRGFYFENEAIHNRELIEIRQIMDEMPDRGIKDRFEKICGIEKFGAKRKVIDEAFDNFKGLLSLEGD